MHGAVLYRDVHSLWRRVGERGQAPWKFESNTFRLAKNNPQSKLLVWAALARPCKTLTSRLNV